MVEESSSKTIKKISNRINYKVIAIIVALTAGDLIYGLYFFDGSYFDIKDGWYMAGLASIGVCSIIVARKY